MHTKTPTDYRLLSDEMLIKLLRTSDETALKEIYLRHWQSLFQAALRKVRVKEIAEELVQNIFVSLWDRRTIQTIEQLSCYLHTAIKYQVINYLKSKILDKKYLSHAVQQSVMEDNSCESTLLTHELSLAIDQAIRELPPKTQLVFRLSRFENRSIREISQSMNISEKAVEYHITQSLKIMRLHLKDFILFDLTILNLLVYFF